MGALATTAGLSRDLFYGANVLFRGARGALAMAAIAASAAFGAVCGSSVATAATMGRVSIPEMLRARYSHELAAGLPDARLKILPGCAHVPQLQSPEMFLATIGDFLTA